jgi:dienelactone hydrolase
VPDRFFRQPGGATGLALLLPGLRYTCDKPLLHYPTLLFLQRGMDVLQVNTDYTTPAFQSAPPRDQARWLATDAQAAVRAARTQRDYRRLVLVGKSIGTLALAHLVTTAAGEEAGTIWLTPLLRQPQLVEAALRCKGPALFIAGTGDSTYDASALDRIREATGAEALLVESGDHSLEISGDPFQSLHALEEILRFIAGFLDHYSQTS